MYIFILFSKTSYAPIANEVSALKCIVCATKSDGKSLNLSLLNTRSVAMQPYTYCTVYMLSALPPLKPLSRERERERELCFNFRRTFSMPFAKCRRQSWLWTLLRFAGFSRVAFTSLPAPPRISPTSRSSKLQVLRVFVRFVGHIRARATCCCCCCRRRPHSLEKRCEAKPKW